MERKVIGSYGEKITAQWLASNGFTILHHNFTTRLGEVDIIASKGEVLAFIEVKTRSFAHFPISTVITRTKQMRIYKAASRYILQNNIQDKVLRFDVATVTNNDGTWEVDYIENAFTGPASR